MFEFISTVIRKSYRKLVALIEDVRTAGNQYASVCDTSVQCSKEDYLHLDEEVKVLVSIIEAQENKRKEEEILRWKENNKQVDAYFKKKNAPSKGIYLVKAV